MKGISRKHLTTKILFFVVGLFIMALGVAFSVKANLGVSPISCVPYVLSLNFDFSLGELTIFFNSFLVLLQILLLRRRYRPIQLMQLPAVFVFGYFIDFSMLLVRSVDAQHYISQLTLCLLSCVTIAIGVFLIVKANLTYLPGDGLAVAIADLLNKEFGKIKVSIDSSMVISGIVVSFMLMASLQGIREGTIVAALLVGFLVKQCVKYLSVVDQWLPARHPQ